jgi:hypothetical protein
VAIPKRALEVSSLVKLWRYALDVSVRPGAKQSAIDVRDFSGETSEQSNDARLPR